MGEKLGSYRIVSELGRGGMGVVLKGYDDALERPVAIKVLGEHVAGEASYVARFIREAQNAAKLNHPNIVQIYFIGEDQGRHYFVMEFVEGRSLQQVLRSEGRIEPSRATELMRQAAAGLAAAHDRGVIHRDIKPANLMLCSDGRVKIADFGLAFMPEGGARLTATGGILGTPGYLSPEQCMAEVLDRRTDIYSLGISYYELLSGVMPFKADSPFALVHQVVTTTPVDVSLVNPQVGSEIAVILRRMIAKKREERYPDCHALLADLDAYLAKRGYPVHLGSRPTPVPLPGDGKPLATIDEDSIATGIVDGGGGRGEVTDRGAAVTALPALAADSGTHASAAPARGASAQASRPGPAVSESPAPAPVGSLSPSLRQAPAALQRSSTALAAQAGSAVAVAHVTEPASRAPFIIAASMLVFLVGSVAAAGLWFYKADPLHLRARKAQEPVAVTAADATAPASPAGILKVAAIDAGATRAAAGGGAADAVTGDAATSAAAREPEGDGIAAGAALPSGAPEGASGGNATAVSDIGAAAASTSSEGAPGGEETTRRTIPGAATAATAGVATTAARSTRASGYDAPPPVTVEASRTQAASRTGAGSAGADDGDLDDAAALPATRSRGRAAAGTDARAASGAAGLGARADERVALPATPRVLVVGSGEALLADAVVKHLQDALRNQGYDVPDLSNMPEIEDRMGGGANPLGGGALDAPLRASGIGVVVVARIEPLGERELNYMGRRDYATTARLRVNAFLAAGHDGLGPGWNEKVEYTNLTVERKAEAVVDGLGQDLAEAIRSGWAAYRSRHGR